MFIRCFILAIPMLVSCGALEKVRSDFRINKKIDKTSTTKPTEPELGDCSVAQAALICSPPEGNKRLLAWQKSKDKWIGLVAQHGNSYTYKSSTLFIGGEVDQTTVTIHSGMVQARSFLRTVYESGCTCDGGVCTLRAKNAGTITEQWQEDSTNLSFHPGGAPAKTIDELYQTCRSLILNDVAASFETGRQGIMDEIMMKCLDNTEGGVIGGNGTRIDEIMFH